MIIPHPESDLSLNLMVLGTDIVKFLKSHKGDYVLTERVLEDFLKRDSRRSVEFFLNSLSFLYCFGLIDQTEYKIRIIPQTKVSKQQELF